MSSLVNEFTLLKSNFEAWAKVEFCANSTYEADIMLGITALKMNLERDQLRDLFVSDATTKKEYDDLVAWLSNLQQRLPLLKQLGVWKNGIFPGQIKEHVSPFVSPEVWVQWQSKLDYLKQLEMLSSKWCILATSVIVLCFCILAMIAFPSIETRITAICILLPLPYVMQVILSSYHREHEEQLYSQFKEMVATALSPLRQ